MERIRFRRLMELLEAALDQPAPERRAWLDGACPDDPEILEEARALLELASARSSDHVTDELKRRVGGAALDATSGMEHPERIGPYRIGEVLGQGGMGTVYSARQTEPFDREVALKVVRSGILREQVAARFEAEMRVLASLDHPHIARIFDAGATDSGVPYFAMERIHGKPITTFCDDGDVPADQRLDLFLQVLKAVGHAHQRAVVHRDLKPSNILVAEFEGDPLPKVIDFGIAAVLADVPGAAPHAGDPGPETSPTGIEGLFGTPAYMSPEAAAGRAIDTRSDVYSLGVVLHELMTGALGPDGGTALDGDLDPIVRTAMAADPEERYGSVTELADEIRRYRTGYPVLAKDGTTRYKLRRFVGRHRLPVLGAATALAALLTVTGIFTHRLAEERDRARIEAEKATQVAQFLEGLFQVPDPMTPTGSDRTARELLDEGAGRIHAELSNQPEVQASLLGVIGRTYRGLGLWDEAEARLTDALRRERRLKGGDHPDVAARLHDIGDVRNLMGDLQGAEEALREALALRRRGLGPTHPETASTLTLLSLVLRNGGELPEAELLAREAVAILRREPNAAPGPRPERSTMSSRREALAGALHTLAFVLRTQERLSEAEAFYRDALALRRELHESSHPDVLLTLGNLALTLEGLGRYEEAEAGLREVLDARRERLGEEHPNTLNSLNNLAYMQWRVGRYAEAETLFREAISIARDVFAGDHPSTAIMINNLGVALLRSGDAEGAVELHREALAMNRRILGPEHPRVAGDLDNLGRAVLATGDRAHAEALHRDALEMRTRLLGAEHPDVAESLMGLAAVRRDAGAIEEAIALLRRALGLRTARFDPDNPRVSATMHELGVMLREAGDLKEAESRLRDALDGRTTVLDASHPDVAITRRELAAVLRRTGRLEEAERLLLEARRDATSRLGPGDQVTRAIDDELGNLQIARGASSGG